MTNEKAYYEVRESDPSLQDVEVFITQGTNSSGRYFAEGNIYSMKRYEADKLQSEATAEIVDVAPLKATMTRMDTLTSQLQEAVQKVHKNERLSPAGKREDIDLLLNQYQAAADEIQEKYASELDKLRASELANTTKFIEDAKMVPYEIRTQAGLVVANVTMAQSFAESMRILSDKVATMDRAVARELLAQFVEIKRDLESKRKGNDVLSRSRESREMLEVYEKLEDAVLSPEQKKAKGKYRMLEAIAQQRSTAPSDQFNQTKRAIANGMRNM